MMKDNNIEKPFSEPEQEINWILDYDGPDSFLLLHDMVAGIEEHAAEMKEFMKSLSEYSLNMKFLDDEI